MKKLIAYTCVVIGLVVLGCSSSNTVTLKIFGWANAHMRNAKWWGKPISKWGDLSRLSLLDGIPRFQEIPLYTFEKATDNGRKNINLYLYGDSHTSSIPAYAFANINHYYYGRNTSGFPYTIDTGEKNILIIETTERHVLSSFSDTSIFDIVRKKDDANPIKITNAGDAKKTISDVINKNLEF